MELVNVDLRQNHKSKIFEFNLNYLVIYFCIATFKLINDHLINQQIESI